MFPGHSCIFCRTFDLSFSGAVTSFRKPFGMWTGGCRCFENYFFFFDVLFIPKNALQFSQCTISTFGSVSNSTHTTKFWQRLGSSSGLFTSLQLMHLQRVTVKVTNICLPLNVPCVLDHIFLCILSLRSSSPQALHWLVAWLLLFVQKILNSTFQVIWLLANRRVDYQSYDLYLLFWIVQLYNSMCNLCSAYWLG